MTGYSLSRRWWDWCFRHQGQFSPTHSALYHWYVEWCNRSEWPETFEMAPQYAMSAIGIRSYNTYKDALIDLIRWGFVRLLQKGENQYAPWILALSNFDEPSNNPLDNPNQSAVSNFDVPLNKAYNKALDNPLDNPRDAYTINYKPQTQNLKPEPFSAGSAGEISIEPESKKKGEPHPPPTPAPVNPPIPIPVGKLYGDGRLQAEVIAYYNQFPDQFPLSIYLPFIRWWTQKYQKGNVERIGWEKWRAMDSWDTETRLNNWYERERLGNQSNGNTKSDYSSTFLARQRAAEPQTVADYGDF